MRIGLNEVEMSVELYASLIMIFIVLSRYSSSGSHFHLPAKCIDYINYSKPLLSVLQTSYLFAFSAMFAAVKSSVVVCTVLPETFRFDNEYDFD